MKKLFYSLTLILVTIFAGAAFAPAQSNEIAVTAGIVRVNPDFQKPDFKFNQSIDQVGFNIGLTHYGKGALGITGEIGAAFKSTNTSDSSLVTILAGPTLKLRNRRIQPSVRALFGVDRLAAANSQLSTRFSGANSGFAFDLGGAIDVAVTKRFKLRLASVDYLGTRNLGQWTNYARAGAGIVYSF